MPKLIITIPAYNEEKTIADVINRIPKSIIGIDKIEILVVNDGSTDNTARIVKEQTLAMLISHKINLGLGRAFKTSLEEAIRKKADIMVNIDADGQFDPQDIEKLVKPILEKRYDCVLASRFIDKNNLPQKMPGLKIWGNKMVAYMINKLTGKKFYDISCGFRAYSKEALLNLNLFGEFTYTQEVILDLSFKGLNIKEIPIEVKYFDKRQSRVAKNIFKYAYNILKINFRIFRDYKPMKFFGWPGIIIFLIGLIMDLAVFIHYINTGSFTPYKSVIFTGGALNLFGFLILIVGLLADMLYRIRVNQEKLLYYEKKKNYE